MIELHEGHELRAGHEVRLPHEVREGHEIRLFQLRFRYSISKRRIFVTLSKMNIKYIVIFVLTLGLSVL